MKSKTFTLEDQTKTQYLLFVDDEFYDNFDTLEEIKEASRVFKSELVRIFICKFEEVL